MYDDNLQIESGMCLVNELLQASREGVVGRTYLTSMRCVCPGKNTLKVSLSKRAWTCLEQGCIAEGVSVQKT